MACAARERPKTKGRMRSPLSRHRRERTDAQHTKVCEQSGEGSGVCFSLASRLPTSDFPLPAYSASLNTITNSASVLGLPPPAVVVRSRIAASPAIGTRRCGVLSMKKTGVFIAA